jgi:hypothetical protein
MTGFSFILEGGIDGVFVLLHTPPSQEMVEDGDVGYGMSGWMAVWKRYVVAEITRSFTFELDYSFDLTFLMRSSNVTMRCDYMEKITCIDRRICTTVYLLLQPPRADSRARLGNKLHVPQTRLPVASPPSTLSYTITHDPPS